MVTLLGRNGAGKTTTLKSIMGIVGQRTGSVRFEGRELIGLRLQPDRARRHRVLPGGARHFRQPQRRGKSAAAAGGEAGRPVARRASSSCSRTSRSGSARARAPSSPAASSRCWRSARILRTGARLLLLDEPTEGLAPVIIQQIGKTIRTLKEQGFTILLVEQNFRFASTVADRYYVMEHGRVVDKLRQRRTGRQSRKAARLSRSVNEKCRQRRNEGGM